MTPQEFYERLDAERGEMSWAAFVREFDDLTGKDLAYLLKSRNNQRLPPIPTLIGIDVLFTADEMRNLLEQKLEDKKTHAKNRRLAESYLLALPPRKRQDAEQKKLQNAFKKRLVRASNTN